MRALDTLPRRSVDDTGGQLATKLYRVKLSGFSNEALSYLVERGLEVFEWFPTIAQCLELLRGWPNRDIALVRHDRASLLIQRELNLRLDEVMAKLRARELSDEEVNALPEQFKRIGWTKALLWKFDDGTYAVRPDPMTLEPEELATARAWVAANAERLVHA